MKKIKLLFILALTVLVAACENDKTNPWCDEHKSIHQQHADTVTQVNIEYRETGMLTVQVDVPQSEASQQALSDITQVIDATANTECHSLPAEINTENDRWLAEYRIDCGADNRLKQVSVVLLNNFVKVAEVEARIQTPAASKHFVLNRQCDRPIFVL